MGEKMTGIEEKIRGGGDEREDETLGLKTEMEPSNWKS